jgi:hypothetical protein
MYKEQVLYHYLDTDFISSPTMGNK